MRGILASFASGFRIGCARMAKLDKYVLYYNRGNKRGDWYAVKRPGDGGVDWEYSDDPKKAGTFSFSYLRRWVKLHGKKAGWRKVETA